MTLGEFFCHFNSFTLYIACTLEASNRSLQCSNRLHCYVQNAENCAEFCTKCSTGSSQNKLCGVHSQPNLGAPGSLQHVMCHNQWIWFNTNQSWTSTVRSNQKGKESRKWVVDPYRVSNSFFLFFFPQSKRIRYKLKTQFLTNSTESVRPHLSYIDKALTARLYEPIYYKHA